MPEQRRGIVTKNSRYHIYIFGVNGYIGKHLACFAKAQHYRVLGLDLDEGCALGPDIDYCKFDITRRDAFDQLDFNVDHIYFLAGLTGTEAGFSTYEPYTLANQLGLNHLLDRMAGLKSRARIVFPSTRLVYKGQAATPLAEDAKKAPLSLYALNKLSSEYLLQIYANRYDLCYTVFRICVPYGNRFDMAYSYGTMGFFLSMARQKKNLTLYGDGRLQRTFVHVADICRIMIRASQPDTTANRIFNIGGETLSLLDIARPIAKKFGVAIEFKPFPESVDRLESGDTIFDDTKLQSVFPYTYKYHFHGWLKRIPTGT